MISEAVSGIVERLIADQYPHIEYPALLRATITQAAEGPEIREPVTAVNTGTGERVEWEVIRRRYTYTVRVIEDEDAARIYPALPGIVSMQQYQPGDTVVIGLPGGELQPVILGGA